MLVRRSTSWLLLGATLLAGSGALGCGYSEEEMQAKVREIEGLKTQLSAEQAQNKKAKSELDEAAARSSSSSPSSRQQAWTSPT